MRRTPSVPRILVGAALGAGVLALATLSATPGPAHAEPNPVAASPVDVSLRVMTWNIHHAEGPDNPGVADIERIAAVIRAEDPDVVTLNEVHDDVEGDHGQQPAELAELLADDGYRYTQYGVSESSLPHGTRGEMVLSKYPFSSEAEHVRLLTEGADPGGKARRGLLKTTIGVPGVGDVRVFATHLSTPSSPAHVFEDQLGQVRTVLEHIRPTGKPVILAGDFNIRMTDAESQEFSRNNLMQSWIAESGLVETWSRINDGADGPTMAGSYGRPDGQHPDRRIDFVYASPAFEVDAGHVSLVDRYASDHLAVVMDLRLEQSAPVGHQTVLAGEDGLRGWAQVVNGRKGNLRLAVCKNHGTAVDDGTEVRATLRRANGNVLRTLSDGGTSRDRCTTDTWTGTLPRDTRLQTCLVDGAEALHCRQEKVD